MYIILQNNVSVCINIPDNYKNFVSFVKLDISSIYCIQMNDSFKIKGTYDTPAVNFEPKKGMFEISGRSLPQNSIDFYSPILDKITDYMKSPQTITKFEFKMEFVNSSSTKIFQEIFYELNKAHQNGTKIQVKWYYKFGDDDMKELGDDLRMYTAIPFEFVAFE